MRPETRTLSLGLLADGLVVFVDEEAHLLQEGELHRVVLHVGGGKRLLAGLAVLVLLVGISVPFRPAGKEDRAPRGGRGRGGRDRWIGADASSPTYGKQ